MQKEFVDTPKRKLNFRVLLHIESLATWLLCTCVSKEGVLIPYFVRPRFACRTSKNSKMLFSLHEAVRTFKMTWRKPFRYRSTQSAFSTKMTEMPLANLRLTKGQTRSKPSQNNTFHSFTSNQSFSKIFGNFDLELTPNGLQKPKFWSSCQNRLKPTPLQRLSNFQSNDYLWVKIGVRTAKISWKPG